MRSRRRSRIFASTANGRNTEHFCDRLFFATHKDVPLDLFPEDCGLFLSDGYGGHLLRDAPEHRLPPATRKAVTLNFSRAAAQRLMLAEWATGKNFDEM